MLFFFKKSFKDINENFESLRILIKILKGIFETNTNFINIFYNLGF